VSALDAAAYAEERRQAAGGFLPQAAFARRSVPGFLRFHAYKKIAVPGTTEPPPAGPSSAPRGGD